MDRLSLKLFVNSRTAGESSTKKENILVKIWNAIKNFFKNLWERIVAFKNKIVNWLRSLIKKRDKNDTTT